MLLARPSLRIPLIMASLAVILSAGPVLAGDRATVVYDGLGDRAEIALTIDDGNDTAVCRQMLRTLRERHVRATFFPVATNVAAHPDFWRDVASDHPIANHTTDHATLTALDDRRIRWEIRRAERIIEGVIGRPIVKVLRPPYGAWDDAVRRVAAGSGYPVLLLWDTSAADTALHSTPDGMVRAALRGTNGSVLLMHCNRQVSADILPRIIAGYRRRGFHFVTVAHLLRRAGYVTRR